MYDYIEKCKFYKKALKNLGVKYIIEYNYSMLHIKT